MGLDDVRCAFCRRHLPTAELWVQCPARDCKRVLAACRACGNASTPGQAIDACGCCGPVCHACGCTISHGCGCPPASGR